MTLPEDLSALESTGLISLAAVVPELEYLFRHALIQESAYESLLKKDRSRLHLAVGEALESMHADHLDDVVATLAYHFERAGATEKAVRYLLRAADRGRASFANSEAIAMYRSGLRLLDEIVGDDAERRQRWREVAAALGAGLGEVLFLVGEHDEARSAFEAALEALPEEELIGRSLMWKWIGTTYVSQREFEHGAAALARAEQLLGESDANPDPAWIRAWVDVQFRWLTLLYWRGEVEQMAEREERIRPIVEEHGTPQERVDFYSDVVSRRLRAARYEVGEETLAASKAMMEAQLQIDSPLDLAWAHFMHGFCLLWYGELDGAEPHIIEAVLASERLGDVTLRSRALNYATVLARKRGQVEEVRALVAVSIEAANKVGLAEYVAQARGQEAWVAWRDGDLEGAEAKGVEAYRAMQALPMPFFPFVWMGLCPAVAVRFRQGKTEGAVDLARALFSPTAQPLPLAVAGELQQAIEAWEAGDAEGTAAHFEAWIEAASAPGYL